LITPGTSLIVTDAPAGADDRSGSDFNILTSARMQQSAPRTVGRRPRLAQQK